MEAFYGGRLGLETRRSLGRLIITAGDTQIVFSEDRQASDPFYHFAFNIPENKIVAAREWQLARSPLLPIPERNRAAGLPPDIVDYSHWNAHSIFFLDPGGQRRRVHRAARSEERRARCLQFA